MESGAEELLHLAQCGILRARHRPVEDCTACATRGEVQVRQTPGRSSEANKESNTHLQGVT